LQIGPVGFVDIDVDLLDETADGLRTAHIRASRP